MRTKSVILKIDFDQFHFSYTWRMVDTLIVIFRDAGRNWSLLPIVKYVPHDLHTLIAAFAFFSHIYVCFYHFSRKCRITQSYKMYIFYS